MGIKSHFIDKRIKQFHKKNVISKEHLSLSQLRKILIIVDEKTAFTFEKFRVLKNKMKLSTDNFIFLTIKDKRSNYNEFRGVVLLQHEINWQGKINSKEVKPLLGKTYDLLIDFTTADNPLKKLVTSMVKAPVKVGYFFDDTTNLYDIMINTPVNEVDAFVEELVRYLQIMGVLQ